MASQKQADWIQHPETRDLSPWQIPMQPIPKRVETAIAAGVQSGPTIALSDAHRVLDLDNGGDGLTDAVIRLPNANVLVACLTQMPGVTSKMWDWWFSWHSFASERYQLWHPTAHLYSALAHDRRGETAVRDRWVGNTSYVDEYIGDELQRLEIRFVPPSTLGLDQARVDQIGLAVCARTALRRERLAAGHLVHLIEDTADGCRMHSRFWIGNAASELPVVAPLIDRIVNQPSVKRRLIDDAAGLALLRHCSEEMNHLARFLPDLYERFGDE